jgi:hypothetical protein
VNEPLRISTKASTGIRSCCKIADEFEDDLMDDRVRKGRKTAERSPVSARKTTILYFRTRGQSLGFHEPGSGSGGQLTW